MKNWRIWLLGQLLLIVLLGGCSTLELVQQRLSQRPVDTATPMPAHPLYVIASAVSYHELLVVDPASWQIVRRSPLLQVGTWDFSRDPQGRVWLGYGAEPGADNRVQIFAADGTLLKTFTPCVDPFNKIHFAAGRAFIPCSENGFHAMVVVVDLQSLEIQQKLDIRVDPDTFLLISSGGSQDYFVLFGGGDTETNHFIVIDTHTLAILPPVSLPYGVPVRILTYQQQFLLLNSNPDPKVDSTQRQDLFVVDATQNFSATTHSSAAWGALWGAIDGDALYIYHNIEQNGLREDPTRAISRLDLRTQQSEVWSLPDRWNADDLAIVNDEIILVHSIGSQPDTSGLYRFDPTTGMLTMLVNIPYAQRILPPNGK